MVNAKGLEQKDLINNLYPFVIKKEYENHPLRLKSGVLIGLHS
jgi:hypothetical protein